MRARPSVLLAAGTVLLALAVGPTARADAPAPRGPLFAVRAGLALPQGDIARDGPELGDVAERKIPLGLELGYRFGPRFWAELLFELAPGSAASRICAEGANCSVSDARIGLAVLLRLAPRARVDPWLGAGVGVEVMNAKGWNPDASSTQEWSWAGIELPFVEAGLDVSVSDRVGIGPWASATMARFTSESIEAGGGTVSGKIHGRATHSWISAGVKATLKL